MLIGALARRQRAESLEVAAAWPGRPAILGSRVQGLRFRAFSRLASTCKAGSDSRCQQMPSNVNVLLGLG